MENGNLSIKPEWSLQNSMKNRWHAVALKLGIKESWVLSIICILLCITIFVILFEVNAIKQMQSAEWIIDSISAQNILCRKRASQKLNEKWCTQFQAHVWITNQIWKKVRLPINAGKVSGPNQPIDKSHKKAWDQVKILYNPDNQFSAIEDTPFQVWRGFIWLSLFLFGSILLIIIFIKGGTPQWVEPRSLD